MSKHKIRKKMEDCKEEELDDWSDMMMSCKGIFLGYGPENYGSKSIDEILKEGDFGFNDHEEEGCEDELNTSMDVDDKGVIKSGASIAERRAVKCGFNASKISSPRFRCGSLGPCAKGLCTPYVTSISPQGSLDSPILLPNSQSSPTTGSFVSRPLEEDGQMFSTQHKENDGGLSMYKVDSETSSPTCFHDVNNMVPSTGGLAPSLLGNNDCQSFSSGHSPLDYETPIQFHKEVDGGKHDAGSPHDRVISDALTVNSNLSTFQPCVSSMPASLKTPHENGNFVGDDVGTYSSMDGNPNGMYLHTGNVRTAEDGYNWRKYGQKQVKGSEYPRSYYKCTQPNCPVTKKVERSHDGQITEIIYKGTHNHPKRQPSRRSSMGSSPFPFNETSDIKNGYKDVGWSDWRFEGLERTSSTSAMTEVSDPPSNTQGKQMCVLDSAGTPEFSSTFASNEDVAEDAATQGSLMIVHDSENEPDLKRRKKDGCFPETTLGSRSVREPRVVVQIESEIDILDDGYRWRKYGQKVVKGNPNPRSYYKCTSSGCTVTKQVERSSESKRFVITTYVGKHNHEVPAARNSNHAHINSGSLLLPATTSTQTALTLPRNSHIPKPEPSSYDLPLHFDAKMECNNDILRANFPDARVHGNSSFYPMRFPAMPNTTPYSPFGHHPPYASAIVPSIPELSFPLPIGFPHAISSYCNPERSHSSVESLYGGQQLQESGIKLLRPKQEGQDDSFFENEMHSIDHTKPSSVYNHHVMENFQP